MSYLVPAFAGLLAAVAVIGALRVREILEERRERAAEALRKAERSGWRRAMAEARGAFAVELLELIYLNDAVVTIRRLTVRDLEVQVKKTIVTPDRAVMRPIDVRTFAEPFKEPAMIEYEMIRGRRETIAGHFCVGRELLEVNDEPNSSLFVQQAFRRAFRDIDAEALRRAVEETRR